MIRPILCITLIRTAKNASPILCELLATLFKMYLIHGHVSSVIMVSTVIPLIKDKLGNITSSNNYRSIALSSLVLKHFDWIILLLHGDKLGTDGLQFGTNKRHRQTCARGWP